MKKSLRILAGLLSAVLIIMGLTGCEILKPTSEPTVTEQSSTEESSTEPSSAPTEPETSTEAQPAGMAESTVSKDEKFGAALMALSQETFEAAGFTLGDSCDVTFGNGFSFSDVPYYNGYYVKNGAPVIVAYPGNPFVSITFNNMGIWDEIKLTEGEKVTVSLNQKGRYLDVQEALGQQYSFLREDYESDEQFCNFRALLGGNLKENLIYRGASPVDNSRRRAAYTDKLLSEKGIRLIVDLADSEQNMTGYQAAEDFNSPYAAGLHQKGKMILLDMSSSYASEAYHQKVVEGFRAILANDGPFYVHCMEGKDRTGFVCMLLEALAGATYEEMRRDYMITYRNYFRVDPTATPEKYQAITELYFDAFMDYLYGGGNISLWKDTSFQGSAIVYLVEGGMQEDEIAELIAKITE